MGAELQSHMGKQTLDTLKDMGVRLSIDDFGAGYSSLGVFEQIPASVVKLDRSFLLNQENHNRTFWENTRQCDGFCGYSPGLCPWRNID